MKRIESQFDKDVRHAIETDPEYAAGYFEELMTRPLPAQLLLLRKFLGLTQAEMARDLGLKQTHISRLEKADSDHLLSLYQKAARRVKARLALVPNNMVMVPKAEFKKLVAAQKRAGS